MSLTPVEEENERLFGVKPVTVYEFSVLSRKPAKAAKSFLAVDEGDAFAQYVQDQGIPLQKVDKFTLHAVKVRGPFQARFNDTPRRYEIDQEATDKYLSEKATGVGVKRIT